MVRVTLYYSVITDLHADGHCSPSTLGKTNSLGHFLHFIFQKFQTKCNMNFPQLRTVTSGMEGSGTSFPLGAFRPAIDVNNVIIGDSLARKSLNSAGQICLQSQVNEFSDGTMR